MLLKKLKNSEFEIMNLTCHKYKKNQNISNLKIRKLLLLFSVYSDKALYKLSVVCLSVCRYTLHILIKLLGFFSTKLGI